MSTASGDMNNFTGNGSYTIYQGLLNRPFDWGIALVFTNNGFVAQIAKEIPSNRTFERTRTQAGTWSDWKEIVFSSFPRSNTKVSFPDQNGTVRIPMQEFGVSSRPQAILITIQSAFANAIYEWDESENEIVLYFFNPDGSHFTGAVRYGYLVIP